jgi:hypothetical protein
MSHRRRARKAKQARRDERRAKRRKDESSTDTTLREVLRSALAGHPLGLLSLASVAINSAKPEPLLSPKSARRDADYLDRILDGLIGVRVREVSALLAVIAELLVAEPAAQLDADRSWPNEAGICRDGFPRYHASRSTARCAELMCSVMLTKSWSVCDSTVGMS